ncbi:MAG: SDR family NAD(P)-dependent oxidoreductase [Bacteroidales bacterium]|nr:SDR family NAD(P)-dependent oxidoreductase [Bacteroidales bacterium]
MNIIITGASQGIGFEVASKFAFHGNHNIIAIARSESKLERLRNACAKINPQAKLHPIPFDLASDDLASTNLKELIGKHFTHIDVLINNAGLLINSPLDKLPDEDLWRMIRVNFAAPAQLIKLLLPMLKKGSHVVNISSMGGFQGSAKFPGLSIYSATKAALANLTECLAEEQKESGIAFNCLALGAVATEMLAEAFPGYKAPTSATEMADFICNFALTGHSHFNGKILPVSLSTP